MNQNDNRLWVPETVWPLVAELSQRLLQKGWRLCSAESCTGGLIAAACTAVSGSSDWFERGFVTYSNEAKSEQLGVAPELIAAHGAVSGPVAQAMVRGAVGRARAQVGLAVTGVAGPTGGSPDKPVGTVWFGWAVQDQVWSERQVFAGDRGAVRAATVEYALRQLVRHLQNH